MKKFISVLLCGAMVLTSSLSVFAANPLLTKSYELENVKSEVIIGTFTPALTTMNAKGYNKYNAKDIQALLMIDGTLVGEYLPIIKNGTTFVPVRVIAENFGYEVNWVASQNKVEIKNDDNTIELFIDSNTAYVNGTKKTIKEAPFASKGTTYLPLRFVAEELGLDVGYENDLAFGIPIVWVSETVEEKITENEVVNILKQKLKESMENTKKQLGYDIPIKTDEFIYKNKGSALGNYWRINVKEPYVSHYINYDYLIDKQTGETYVVIPFGVAGDKYLTTTYIAN